MKKTVFVSDNSYGDAELMASLAGFVVVGRSQNKKGQYVVFARKYGGIGL